MNDMFFPLYCNGYVAQLCGEKAAIIFHQISYLIYNNQNDGINIHDGKAWMTKTLAAWGQYYPNMTPKQVFLALKKLEDEDLIISANFNTETFNQSKWYSITEKGWQYVNLKFSNKNGKLDFPNREQEPQKTFPNRENVARANKVPLLLYRNTVKEGETRARLNKPLNAGEVVEEAGKRHYAITESQAQEFIDRYESTAEGGTWMIGNTIVTDWRKLLTLRWLENWQRDNRKSKTGDGNSDSEPDGQSMDEFGEGVRLEREALGIK